MKTLHLIGIILVMSLFTIPCQGDAFGGPFAQQMGLFAQFPASLSAQALIGQQPLGGTYLSGVDVSSYDGTINWDTLKAAVDFAIIRSSCGVGYTDPNIAYNRSEARRVGILHGYYHYSYPDLGNTAVNEADYMLSAIGTLQTGEVLCLDYERSYSDPVNWCLAFLNRIYARTGLKPFIYMNMSTINSYNWSPIINAGYPLWLAYWDGNPNPATPSTPWGFTAMKQWNAEANINIGGLTNADVDSFNGTAAAFMAYGTAGSTDTQAPTVPTNLSGTAISTMQVNLTWTASTDNYGVAGYKVYRNGTQTALSTTNSYSDTTVSGGNSYTYTVSAYDSAGNESAQSSPITVTTPGGAELLTNGGFETGNTTGWTAYSRTATPVLSIQTAGVSCGTYYLYEQLTTLNTAGGARQTVTGLTSGATYIISGAMKSVHSDVTVSVKVDTDGGTDYAAAEQTIASAITSGWQTFSTTVTATGTSMTVFLDSSQTGGVSSSHVGAFDCVSLMGATSSTSIPGQPTVAQVNTTTLSVTNNGADSPSGYYAFRINDGSACSNKFVQSDGTVGTSKVWQTKTAWGTKNVTGLTPATSYTFDVAGASDAAGTSATSNRYGGSYMGSPTLGVANKWGSGDTAATFDGSTQYVSAAGLGIDVNLSNGFTIECWANPSALSTWYPVLQLTDSVNYGTFVNHICFDMSGTGGLRGEVYQAGGCGTPCLGNYYVSPSLSFSSGSWHHYAMVVSSGGTLTFYKDGVADAGQALSYMPSSGVNRGRVQIGRRDTTGSYYWHGSLDEVALYSSALSGARIAAHYSAADAATYNTEVIKDNPVAFWRLGETTGTAAADNKGGYSPSATQTTSSCSVPSIPTDGTPASSSTSGITWAWGDVSTEIGYRVKDTGGLSKSGDLAANTVSWTEGSLAPNTQYTRKISAFNACGESTGSTGQTRYTLARAAESTDGTGSTGNVYCTTASKDTWYSGSKTFTFANPAGFGVSGAFKASSFQYEWNQSTTEAWLTAGTSWTAGTISLTPTSGDGSYYLRVRAINGNGIPNNADDLHYGPFKVDATAPSAVTVTDEGVYTPSLDTLKASWTVSSDSGSGIDRYEYAVGTLPDTQNIRGWTSNSTSTSATISGLTLTEGTKYYLQARAVDTAGNPSTGSTANGIVAAPGVARISDAWARANAVDPLSLRNKIVTYSSATEFYLEDGNGSSAIRVASTGNPGKGNLVSVAGVLGIPAVQRSLIGDVVITTPDNLSVPIFAMSGRYLRSGSFNAATPGMTGGVGLYNIGLLVRICGRVDFYDNTTDPSNKFCYIDDGSGLTSDGHKGVKVTCGSVNAPTDGYATMTGVISSQSIGGATVPVILIRDSGDINAF